MFKKKKAVAIAMLITGVLFAGCGGENNGGAKATKEEINVAINAEPTTYDLATTTSTTATQMVMGNVFEKLVSFDENYKAQPELAEKIDVNEDYTEYTYHLRKGVQFHNGQEMKADDVVASMNHWLKSNGLARKAIGKATFKRIDDYTVSVKMDKPNMNLNELIAGLRGAAIIVPKSSIDNVTEKGLIKDYIGTGPYMIDEIKPNSYMKLKKFDNYKPYGEKGKVSGWVGYKEAKTPIVVFNFVPDSSTRVAGMQSGEYDMAVQMPGDDYDTFNKKDNYNVYKEAQGDIGMVYNKKQGVSTSPIFRQAINAALNREDIMKAAYAREDFYKITPSFVQDENNPWYTEKGKDVYNVHDAEKAKALLKEAGYNGEEFRLMVSTNYQEFYNAAVVVEKELKDIGVNVKLDTVDWPTYLARSKDPTAYDALITGFIEWVNPSTIVYLSPSWNGWSTDDKLQNMMDEMIHSTDPKQAKQIWENIQDYSWHDYMPASKFGNRYIYDVSSSRVKDVVFFEGPHMWNLTVEK